MFCDTTGLKPNKQTPQKSTMLLSLSLISHSPPVHHFANPTVVLADNLEIFPTGFQKFVCFFGLQPNLAVILVSLLQKMTACKKHLPCRINIAKVLQAGFKKKHPSLYIMNGILLRPFSYTGTYDKCSVSHYFWFIIYLSICNCPCCLSY